MLERAPAGGPSCFESSRTTCGSPSARSASSASRWELFLHSPVHLDPELHKELDALGPVRFVVAPNRFHHLYVGDYPPAYPGAELWAAPGLRDRRKDLAFHADLSDEAPAGWAGQIDQTFFRYMPVLNEVVFCHRASRTLLLTDLSANFAGPLPWSTRAACALFGRPPGTFGPTRLEHWFMRDRPAARAALERILAWDFDRIVVCHGAVLETGGRQALRAGYRWLLGDPP
jgi:hypothetical protein